MELSQMLVPAQKYILLSPSRTLSDEFLIPLLLILNKDSSVIQSNSSEWKNKKE